MESVFETKQRIIIVDDILENIRLIGTILRNNGFLVSVAQSGEQALEIIREDPPDLILLDIMMPEMDGFEVCRRLKEDELVKDIPVIFLSALSDIVNKVDGFKIGAVDYVTKPVEAEDLLSRVKVHLTIRSLYRQLEDANERLEEKVRIRTEELQKAHDLLEVRVEQRTEELRNSLEQLKQTQDHMIKRERLVALNNLVTGVSHEINTPLGISITEVSYIEEKTQKCENLFHTNQLTHDDFDKFITTVRSSSKNVLKNLSTVANLVSTFKQVAVDHTCDQQRNFFIREYLSDVLLSLHSQLKETGHTVQINCPEKLELDSYPGVFFQIITHFVTNSLIHGFENRKNGILKFDVAIKDKFFFFEYSDDGRGMEPSVLKQVFDPFFTTKRHLKAFGLGMHIVYNLVTQKLNGTIECQSSPEQGVQFIIKIPLKHLNYDLQG